VQIQQKSCTNFGNLSGLKFLGWGLGKPFFQKRFPQVFHRIHVLL